MRFCDVASFKGVLSVCLRPHPATSRSRRRLKSVNYKIIISTEMAPHAEPKWCCLLPRLSLRLKLDDLINSIKNLSLARKSTNPTTMTGARADERREIIKESTWPWIHSNYFGIKFIRQPWADIRRLPPCPAIRVHQKLM